LFTRSIAASFSGRPRSVVRPNHPKQEERVRRIALAAAIAAVSSVALAGSASADPVGTLCGSVHITVNGSPVVDQAQCQVLPPEGQ
jgi:hypothetical protein